MCITVFALCFYVSGCGFCVGACVCAVCKYIMCVSVFLVLLSYSYVGRVFVCVVCSNLCVRLCVYVLVSVSEFLCDSDSA